MMKRASTRTSFGFGIVFLLVGTLAGCSAGAVKPVVVEKRTNTIPVFHPPLPDAVITSKVEWKVLTPDIMKTYLEKYEAGDAEPMVYYGVTPDGYENLSDNVAELKRYIKQQQAIIMYYRTNLKEVVVDDKTGTPVSDRKTEATP